jgi:hypothetical protein
MPLIRIDKLRNKDKIRDGLINQKIEPKNKDVTKAKRRMERLLSDKPAKIWWKPNSKDQKELLRTSKVMLVYEILFMPVDLNGNERIATYDSDNFAYNILGFAELFQLAVLDGFDSYAEFLKYYKNRYEEDLYGMPFYVIWWS